MSITRSLASTKALSSSLLTRINDSLIARRGYAASAKEETASTGLTAGESTAHTVGKDEESHTIKQGSVKPSSSWGPDPVTGYYKPSDQVTEVDAVDQRESHHKILNSD